MSRLLLLHQFRESRVPAGIAEAKFRKILLAKFRKARYNQPAAGCLAKNVEFRIFAKIASGGRTNKAQKGLHMSETKPRSGEAPEPAPPRKRRGKGLLLMGGLVVLIAGGAGAAWKFVPGLSEKAQSLMGHTEPVVATGGRPVFIDLPEMAVTLPNAGHPRQMRIRLSIELLNGTNEKGTAEALSPRVYDALLTYLRTLRDGEVDGGLGLDRLRADLFRRLYLVMGPGVVRDVLITSLVLA